MFRSTRLGTILVVALVLAHATPAMADRPDLIGRVICEQTQEPIQGATVFIYTAGVRTGTNPFCPSCYPDCGKRSRTGEDGRFHIAALDPGLIFRVLIVADGYEPLFETGVDPYKGAIEPRMMRHDPQRYHPDRAIRGRVLDPDGKPVVGATVSQRGLAHNGRIIATRAPADPLAITNEQGEFVLTLDEDALSVAAFGERHNWPPGRAQQMFGAASSLTLAAQVSARGLATQNVLDLEADGADNVIRMTEGVMVIGRVVDSDDKPVSGIEIGFVQINRTMGHFLGNYSIGTREDGRFELPNLPPNYELAVYGTMDTLRDRGAIPFRALPAARDGEIIDTGTLSVTPGLTLNGRVVLSDGGVIPPNTRILLSRDTAWDSQSVELEEDGSFEFVGVPGESVSISVRITEYHLSTRNISLDLYNLGSLVGRVNDDIENLVILMEPGQRDMEHVQSLRDNPAGRVYSNPQPRYQPLRGFEDGE